jgi:hypothetical protein
MVAGANASTYTFSGSSGDTFDLGALSTGTVTFNITDDAFIPFPVGSSHAISNSLSFSLAIDTLLSVTFVAGLHTDAADTMNICTPSFCLASGTDSVSAILTPGDYALGVVADIPSAPPDTGAYLSESYGGRIVVGVNPAPLPSTWLMLLSGFVGLTFLAYRRTKMGPAVRATIPTLPIG